MKLGQVGVGSNIALNHSSNIAQNHSSSLHEVLYGLYMPQFTRKVDQKVKLCQVLVVSHLAQNHLSSPYKHKWSLFAPIHIQSWPNVNAKEIDTIQHHLVQCQPVKKQFWNNFVTWWNNFNSIPFLYIHCVKKISLWASLVHLMKILCSTVVWFELNIISMCPKETSIIYLFYKSL